MITDKLRNLEPLLNVPPVSIERLKSLSEYDNVLLDQYNYYLKNNHSRSEVQGRQSAICGTLGEMLFVYYGGKLSPSNISHYDVEYRGLYLEIKTCSRQDKNWNVLYPSAYEHYIENRDKTDVIVLVYIGDTHVCVDKYVASMYFNLIDSIKNPGTKFVDSQIPTYRKRKHG